MAVGLKAVRDAVPPAVALFESVRLKFAALMAAIVVPAGMPVPVMASPTARLSVLVRPVTTFDLAVRVPLKVKTWSGPARSGIPVATLTLPCERLRSVTLTWGRSPPGATAP